MPPESRLGNWTSKKCASTFASSNASRCSMSSFAKPLEPLFVRDAGLSAPVRREEDPYRALDELMVAVEALCPVWPRRDVFVDGGKMLL